MSETRHITVCSKTRLDKLITEHFAVASRAKAQSLIKDGKVIVSGQVAEHCSSCVAGELDISILDAEIHPTKAIAKDIPLDIMFEDNDIIVLNKSAGVVVHPGAGNFDNTIVNGLVFHYGDGLSALNTDDRPGIVHRLDKDTSGLLLVAKNDMAHAALATQFAERTVIKRYIAMCCGIPRNASNTIDTFIARDRCNRKKMAVTKTGKKALTEYKVTETFSNVASKVECRLLTGRTHQIRVHMQHIHCPIIGDKTYNIGEKTHIKVIHDFPRQALHAYYLRFMHPRRNHELEFESPLPDDMTELERRLKDLHVEDR